MWQCRECCYAWLTEHTPFERERAVALSQDEPASLPQSFSSFHKCSHMSLTTSSDALPFVSHTHLISIDFHSFTSQMSFRKIQSIFTAINSHILLPFLFHFSLCLLIFSKGKPTLRRLLTFFVRASKNKQLTTAVNWIQVTTNDKWYASSARMSLFFSFFNAILFLSIQRFDIERRRLFFFFFVLCLF